MGILDRFSARRPPEPQTSLNGVDVSGDDRVAVVGESHYQPELAAIAGPKRPGGVEVEAQAVLVPEPDNEFDPNAVAIYLNGGGKVGYLSREDAIDYQPMVSELAARSQVGACEAVVLGGDASRQTQFCVWLHIAGPDHRPA
jgi:hypothetical protein